MASIRKLPSGRWQIRKMQHGQVYSLIVDTKPRTKEADRLIDDLINSNPDPRHDSFEVCAAKYIEDRSSVLSPATVREYKAMLRLLPSWFLHKPAGLITAEDVQIYVNQLHASPKTVRNKHGFVSSVLRVYHPALVLHTKLPQKEKQDVYIPTDEDVQRLIRLIDEHSPDMSIAVRLACFGLRRGEICALTADDLGEDNVLTISKDMVMNENKEWVIKPPKTPESNRKITLPDYLADMIRAKGSIYKGHPGGLSKQLDRLQKRAGMEHFSLHKLRHYFASNAHTLGIPDAYILKLGGWKTDNVMKNVYRHAQKDKIKEQEDIILKSLEHIAPDK